MDDANAGFINDRRLLVGGGAYGLINGPDDSNLWYGGGVSGNFSLQLGSF